MNKTILKIIHILIIPIFIVLELILGYAQYYVSHPLFGAEPGSTEKLQGFVVVMIMLLLFPIAVKIFAETKHKK